MTFPNKKRNNTKLFNERMAALYMVETWITESTIAGGQRVGTR